MEPRHEKHRIEEELRKIIAKIWQMLLGFELSETKELWSGLEGPLIGITIQGAWNGKLVVHFSDELAQKITREMFDLEEEAAAEEQMFDALKEIVNIVGGNLKASLPEPCTLSLPEVVSERALKHAKSDDLALSFESDNSFISIHLNQQQSRDAKEPTPDELLAALKELSLR
jgi:chemotaxis protein CheX